MEKLRVGLIYSTSSVRWGGVNVQMVPMGHILRNESRMKLFELAKLLDNSGQESLAQEIRESKYEPANLDEVTNCRFQWTQNRKENFEVW